MPNPQALGPASIVMSNVTTAFIGFLPSFTEVRRAGTDDREMKKDLKLGIVAAVSLGVGTGIIVSNLTGSPVPVVVSIVVSAILIGCFQAAMRSE